MLPSASTFSPQESSGLDTSAIYAWYHFKRPQDERSFVFRKSEQVFFQQFGGRCGIWDVYSILNCSKSFPETR